VLGESIGTQASRTLDISEEQRKHECRRSWRLNKNPGDGAWLVDWLFEK